MLGVQFPVTLKSELVCLSAQERRRERLVQEENICDEDGGDYDTCDLGRT